MLAQQRDEIEGKLKTREQEIKAAGERECAARCSSVARYNCFLCMSCLMCGAGGIRVSACLRRDECVRLV